MSSLDEHIRERLDGFYETNYENVPNCFIYQFGPYMAMTLGYETQTDAIAKKSILMKIMQIGAYVLRSLASLPTLENPHDVEKRRVSFLKSTLMQIPNELSGASPEEVKAVERLITSNLVKNPQANESVVTNIAPIVPYEGTVSPFEANEERDNEEKLHTLLLNNLEDILRCRHFTNYSEDKLKIFHQIALNEVMSNDKISEYYLLAAINYNKPPIEVLEAMGEFYSTLTNLDVEMDFEAFETLLDRSIQNSTPAFEEEWEDLTLEDKDEETIQKMLADSGLSNEHRESDPTFNWTTLYNFIALNRYMQFDTWSQRLFIDKFNTANPGDVQIINVNRINEKISAYELSTGIIEVPFVDLRDYKVRIICLRRDDPKPFISGEIIYR